MDKSELLKPQDHPEYNDIIEEVVQKIFDQDLMDIALK